MPNYFDTIGRAIGDNLRSKLLKVDPGVTYDPFRFIAEGRGRMNYWRATNWAATQPTVTAGAANTLGPTVICRPGRKIFLTSLNMSLSGAGQVEGVFDADATNNWQTWVGVPSGTSLYGETRFWESFGVNGGNSNIPANGFVMNENSVINTQYRSNTTTGLNCTFNAYGVEIPNEANLGAEIKIGIVGDSTAHGTNLGNDSQGRAYLGSSMWSEVFRDKARAAGVDCQIFFNDAEDGKTMRECAYRLLTGYTRVKVDVLFVCAGLNDASLAKYPTEAQFKEAANYYITERNRWNPGTSIVFFLPVMTDDPDRVDGNRHANIRTWLTEVATSPIIAGTANRVYLVDPAQVLTLGNADYKEQAPGTYVHPNGLGSTKWGNYAWEQLKGPLFGK